MKDELSQSYLSLRSIANRGLSTFVMHGESRQITTLALLYHPYDQFFFQRKEVLEYNNCIAISYYRTLSCRYRLQKFTAMECFQEKIYTTNA